MTLDLPVCLLPVLLEVLEKVVHIQETAYMRSVRSYQLISLVSGNRTVLQQPYSI